MKNKKAFSLIELSVVILIIGILVAGITQSSRLIEQFRLSSARSLTEGSDVNSINGLVLWLETSLERSLGDIIENGQAVSDANNYRWNDINLQSSIRSNTSSDVGPIFTQRCINNIYCLRFDGTTQFLDTLSNNGFSQGVSVFVVFRVNDLTVDPQTLMAVNGIAHSAANRTFQLNITGSNVQYSYFNSGGVAANLQPTAGAVITAGSVHIADFIDNGVDEEVSISNNSIMNRNIAVSNSGSKNMSVGFTIGSFNDGTRAQFFNGDIAEIIMFNRGLRNEERNAIEDYLAKKWGVNLN
jgi:prepilin-type N-terminal cleavage/methylation domain-containing protein